IRCGSVNSVNVGAFLGDHAPMRTTLLAAVLLAAMSAYADPVCEVAKGHHVCEGTVEELKLRTPSELRGLYCQDTAFTEGERKIGCQETASLCDGRGKACLGAPGAHDGLPTCRDYGRVPVRPLLAAPS